MSKMKWLSAALLLTLGQHALADQNTATITVNVTINASPCEINGNKTIDVDFGNNVAVTDVAAGVVEKAIDYTLDCSSMDMEKSLKMIISGTGAAFNSDVLNTSITDLGIQIKANGADYPLNSAFSFATAADKPALTALLVQKPGARLATGDFSAGATMTVDYQ